VGHQSFVNLNRLASFPSQGGNPPPRREQGPAHAGRPAKGPGMRRSSDWLWRAHCKRGMAARGDCPVGLESGAPTPLRAGNPALDMAVILAG
jgi:hypothetical protein